MIRPSREAYPTGAPAGTNKPAVQAALAQLLEWAEANVSVLQFSHTGRNGFIDQPEVAQEIDQVRHWIETLKTARCLTERQYAAITSDCLQSCEFQDKLLRAGIRNAQLEERVRELEHEITGLREDSLAIEAREQRYLAAIRWALGEAEEFTPPPRPAKYWWRSHLRAHAGLTYSADHGHSIDPAAPEDA